MARRLCLVYEHFHLNDGQLQALLGASRLRRLPSSVAASLSYLMSWSTARFPAARQACSQAISRPLGDGPNRRTPADLPREFGTRADKNIKKKSDDRRLNGNRI